MTLINVLYILVAVLAGGTIFAWTNFFLVTFKKCESCSVGPKGKPDIKCFLGAIFFSVALVLAVYAITLV